MFRTVAIAACLVSLLAAAVPYAQESQSTTAANRPSENSPAMGAIERGSYLVHDVAMCVQCHSPRSADGKLIATRLLQGGTIPLRSPYPDTQWAFRAPGLAGLQGWTEEEFVQLLVTGHTSSGWSPRSPMPPFRMTEPDARAIATYLQSL